MKTVELSCQQGAGHDGQAVIREARRHQRRRRLTTGVAVMLALAGALGILAAMNRNGYPQPKPRWLGAQPQALLDPVTRHRQG
jgi:hypothetical protein